MGIFVNLDDCNIMYETNIVLEGGFQDFIERIRKFIAMLIKKIKDLFARTTNTETKNNQNEKLAYIKKNISLIKSKDCTGFKYTDHKTGDMRLTFKQITEAIDYIETKGIPRMRSAFEKYKDRDDLIEELGEIRKNVDEYYDVMSASARDETIEHDNNFKDRDTMIDEFIFYAEYNIEPIVKKINIDIVKFDNEIKGLQTKLNNTEDATEKELVSVYLRYMVKITSQLASRLQVLVHLHKTEFESHYNILDRCIKYKPNK